MTTLRLCLRYGDRALAQATYVALVPYAICGLSTELERRFVVTAHQLAASPPRSVAKPMRMLAPTSALKHIVELERPCSSPIPSVHWASRPCLTRLGPSPNYG